MNKSHCSACDKNQAPIFSVLTSLFMDSQAVLEIGSGTGQHAVYFAQRLPHLIWYTSDRKDNHDGIRLWLDEAALSNTRPPLLLDVAREEWPEVEVDTVFSANTAHIMSWREVESFFRGVGDLLPGRGLFTLYGPFNYANRYTSDSNAQFDEWLKARDPLSGIRNFEDLDKLANVAGMILKQDFEMPANNRILCWQKQG